MVPLNPVGDVKLSPRDMTWQEVLQARREVRAEVDSAKRQLAEFVLQLAANNLHQPPAQLDDLNRFYHNQLRQKEQRLAGLDTELCMRPALAFGCLSFVLVGCPVGIWFSKSDYLSAFITCFLPIVLIYYPLQLCSTNLSKDGRVAPIVGLWAANALMAVMALPLFHKLLKN
jgi:lipopolysaccharide export system permease protein